MMYRVDIQNKKLIKIPATSFSELNLRERFDIQEWIAGTPEILGESLLVISKELVLPSRRRLDLLAVDKEGALVIIELKRDDSGADVEWQAIKYASYCSSFSHDETYNYFANYLKDLGKDGDAAQDKIEEFIECEPEHLNQRQRIILVSKEFHSEVISAVLWLRESGIDVECVRLRPHCDQAGELFVNPEIIIPLPEAKDYIQKKATKQKKQTQQGGTWINKSNLDPAGLRDKIVKSLTRPSDLTPRFQAFLKIIIEEDRSYSRQEVMQKLHEAGVGSNIGQTGRYLSNISQFLTKKSNAHLRQAIDFETGGILGQTKENYHVVSEYRDLIQQALEETSRQGPVEPQAND